MWSFGKNKTQKLLIYSIISNSAIRYIKLSETNKINFIDEDGRECWETCALFIDSEVEVMEVRKYTEQVNGYLYMVLLPMSKFL